MNKTIKTGVFVFALVLCLFFAQTAFAQSSPQPNPAYEQRVVELINSERGKQGLPPLMRHDTLTSIARAHSEDMLRRNSVSATGSDGSSGLERIRQGGITNSFGQNTLVYGGGDTPEQRVATWMNSSRSTILHEERSHIGIGIVQRPAGSNARSSAYWTLVLINMPPEPAPSETRAFELRVFELTNREREKQGIPPLIWHDTLSDAARAHAEDLTRNNMGGHTGSDGSSPSQRMERAGITNRRQSGENVARGQRTPEAVLASWMSSPGHRANILNVNYTHLGVGFVQWLEGISDQNNAYHWVQKFCSFR